MIPLTKKLIPVALAALLVILALAGGCGAKNAAVGRWQDEKKQFMLNFKNDGTGTFSVYATLLNSTTENELAYTCEGNTIQWKFPGDSEYETLTIENGAIDYEGISLKKK